MKFFKTGLFTICFLIAAATAFGQSSGELKRKRDQLNQELEKLNRELEETMANKKANLKQLSLIKAQISLRESKIKTISSEIGALDNQIQQNNHSVKTLQGQLDQLKKEYASMILFAYHNQSSYNKLSFIFSAENFNQAYKRMTYLQQFGTYRERQAASIRGTQDELHVKINELDRTKKDKSDLLKDQEKERTTLNKDRNNEVQVISQLSKQQGQLKQQQQEKQRNLRAMNALIERTIRREIEEARRKAEEEERRRAAAEAAKAKAEGRAVEPSTVKKITKSSSTSEVLNATPESARLSSDFLGSKGNLPWPIANSGGIIRGFGPYVEAGIHSENSGLEIKTSPGAGVRAVFNGEVRTVSPIGSSFLVIIKHGEYFSCYQNLRSVSVSVGQKVTTKQSIGTVDTDNSTGLAIINFGIWKGGTPINPAPWLAN
ncbi:murein hydrolase activator EnvC family protein [Mucilaginibacter myungsuensis]|uniref:Peptidoglycan DD-metalloendopeptidase family protein n=1 Tax=Mucilaginibacter myungsuensis TaxID=649104 RepID=A0A929L3A5_9SPHI|nr:peptidoglycan DD-metalloendopeptidase family protein [Mucilaginibacter myungsuensis]MBE9663270.1 peptidoglycan DD-metalloendopeptidase family protein [Mucilaginibacter myungsuensis]MDN3600005.1 peptidoglycan DD-metalloendopeptidase family protein [Mucilaginibacter myungsuensis]